jgi:hypothetical protein
MFFSHVLCLYILCSINSVVAFWYETKIFESNQKCLAGGVPLQSTIFNMTSTCTQYTSSIWFKYTCLNGGPAVVYYSDLNCLNSVLSPPPYPIITGSCAENNRTISCSLGQYTQPQKTIATASFNNDPTCTISQTSQIYIVTAVDTCVSIPGGYSSIDSCTASDIYRSTFLNPTCSGAPYYKGIIGPNGKCIAQYGGHGISFCNFLTPAVTPVPYVPKEVTLINTKYSSSSTCKTTTGGYETTIRPVDTTCSAQTGGGSVAYSCENEKQVVNYYSDTKCEVFSYSGGGFSMDMCESYNSTYKCKIGSYPPQPPKTLRIASYSDASCTILSAPSGSTMMEYPLDTCINMGGASYSYKRTCTGSSASESRYDSSTTCTGKSTVNTAPFKIGSCVSDSSGGGGGGYMKATCTDVITSSASSSIVTIFSLVVFALATFTINL